MTNISPSNNFNGDTNKHKSTAIKYPGDPGIVTIGSLNNSQYDILPEILVVSSYPPRKCGIATYSEDLIRVLNSKFRNSFSIKICALESGFPRHKYPDDVKYTLDTSISPAYDKLADQINQDDNIKIVLIQHEFGFFQKHEDAFLQLVNLISVPVIVAFHTVILKPLDQMKRRVQNIAKSSDSVIVMTNNSRKVLEEEYNIPSQKIAVIPHGIHLVTHPDKNELKLKHGLAGRKVLATFGLLGPGKKIETTLRALPAIVKSNPNVTFLVIGKTHPEILKAEGERYRDSLTDLVEVNNLKRNVKFINKYVPLPVLLEYLQLTDIYLFTSNDPNQAVSGTFSYAMSCGCAIISTPIPHAKELLSDETGIIFDFLDSVGLSRAVIRLLNDKPLRNKLSLNALHKIIPTAWENSAVSHACLIEKIAAGNVTIRYNLPAINLSHIKRMTTDKGIIQFSRINIPDIESGYTLDDNSRALVAQCMYFKQTGERTCIQDIRKYLEFIRLCQQPAGNFLNYADKDMNFTPNNFTTNLDDANGRAIWALGYLVNFNGRLPAEIISEALMILEKSLIHIITVYSPRAMAFAVKGLYYYHKVFNSLEIVDLIKIFANRLAHLCKHETDTDWYWFEDRMTYANSILPEAMLYAWLITGDRIYKEYSVITFRFLLSQTFNENGIEVISNNGWLVKGEEPNQYGEQPIDVAYTVITLSKFYDAFNDMKYLEKMATAFSWFLGNNRLHHIVYNPATGGCYDGLEETHVNLNQGAESTLCYLMARITAGKYKSDVRLQTANLKQVKMNVHKSQRLY